MRAPSLRRVLAPAVAVVVLGVIWHLVADGHRYVLPHPSAVLSELVDHPGTYLRDAATTLAEALSGLAIGSSAAVLVALVMSQVRTVRDAVLPLAVLANVTPVVAIAPAIVAAFGFGSTPKIVVTSLTCFFPVLVNAAAGLRDSDPALIEVLETLRASRLEILRYVRLPSSLPYLFTAARIALPLSVIGAVVAEFAAPGATLGLGTLMQVAASNADLPVVYAGVLCLGSIGVVLSALVALAERRVLSWHRSQPRR